jgi:hypothetical protein
MLLPAPGDSSELTSFSRRMKTTSTTLKQNLQASPANNKLENDPDLATVNYAYLPHYKIIIC